MTGLDLSPISQKDLICTSLLHRNDIERIYHMDDLARGHVMFAATGVTLGDYLKGVRFFSGGAFTQSVVMRSRSRTVRTIDTTHCFEFKPNYD